MNILYNGQLSRKEEFSEASLHDGLSLYEVFRVYKGRVIFLEDNIERLENSARKSGWNIPISAPEIAAKLDTLIRAEQIAEGNIKYVLHATARGIEEYIYQIPHNYPSENDYRDGVKVMTLHASRDNAEVKYIHPELREKTNQLIHAHDIYEVLLIDKHEDVTEGSRSNVFFIREGQLHTAPLPSVLPGTTRKRVIELCREENIPVIERRVTYAELPLARAAFLTGTSPLVLPVRQIDRITLDPHDQLLRRVMTRYLSMLVEHV
jgi:branched-chain amino acid aminotransferase